MFDRVSFLRSALKAVSPGFAVLHETYLKKRGTAKRRCFNDSFLLSVDLFNFL